MDVDIVHEQSSGNIENQQASLVSVYTIRRRPDEKIPAPRETDLSKNCHTHFTTRPGLLDVPAFVEGERFHENPIGLAARLPFKGSAPHVLDLETSAEIEKGSRGANDLRRLPVLQETLKRMENVWQSFSQRNMDRPNIPRTGN